MSSFDVGAKYESLEVAAARSSPGVGAPLVVEVTAPATLAEGYELQVCTAGGDTVTVAVPFGGVTKGQTFMATVISSGTVSADNSHNVPVGAWRDGTFSCCAHGVCHPLFWTALCCSPVVLAQVLYRMNLDWTGRPTSRDKGDVNFMTVDGIFAVYTVIRCLTPSPSADTDGTHESSSPVAGYTRVLDLVFLDYIVFVAARVRRFIRNKDAIPAKCCGECEDGCCAFWCGCCTISQMARHAADYDRYAASACSKSGMVPSAPEFV